MIHIDFVVHPHPSRNCGNCAHEDPERLCLQMIGMADLSARPINFACHEHQTPGEWQIGIHRYQSVALDRAFGSDA